MSDIVAAPSSTPSAPAAPAAPVAPAAAAGSAPAPMSREAARSAILQDAQAGIEKIIGAPSPNASETPSAPSAPVAATAPAAPPSDATAAAASTSTTPATDALEIHPEGGPSTELGSVKLRFKGGDGQYTPIPETLAAQKIELQVGGKTYVKDLAGVARLAADGIANARHANENHQFRTQVVPQFEQQVSTLQQQLEAQIALNREILSDEAQYAARRQQFTELNSPEQRLARAEQALTERDRQDAQRAESQHHVAYYEANVLPALVSVLNDAPTVTNEEVMGRIALETGSLLANGVVPPENYPAFTDYLTKTLAPWAKGLHAQRSQADTARREAEQRAEAERRRTAQQTVNTDVGRALAPMAPASTTPVAPGNTTQPPPRSRAEARRQILESAAQMAP